MDTVETLLQFTGGNLEAVGRAVAEVVGISVIKLTMHHSLPLDYQKYSNELTNEIVKFQKYTTLLEVSKMWKF